MARDDYNGGYDDRYDDNLYNNGYDDSYEMNEYSQGGYDEYGERYDGNLSDGYPDDGYYEEEGEWYEEPAPRKRTSGKTGRSTRSSKRTGNTRRAQSSRSKNSRRKSSSRKQQQSIAPVFLTVLLIIILGGSFGLKLFLDKYSYSKERADLTSYFGITAENDVPIIWNDEFSEIRARKENGTYYMDLSSVQNNLNGRFYYGAADSNDETGMIIYALPTELVMTTVGSSEVSVGDAVETKSYTPAIEVGDEIYLALDFVKEYTNFAFAAYDEPNRLVLTSSWDVQTTASVNKNTQIRTSGGIKSDILTDVEKNDTVTVLDQMDEWSKVVSADGFIGYVENKRLSDVAEVTPVAVSTYTEPVYETHGLGEKVNMAFHNVYSTAAAQDTLSPFMSKTKSVNVIAPTIFWVTNENGDISSFASQQYVDNAHAMGLKVWAVVDNINSPTLTNTSSFLHTLERRRNLIDQLLREVSTYGYDGINVDFELIDQSYGQDYVEFIRELSIECRNRGLTLSVDNYPAYEFNSHYNIAEQGVFVDYVVVMGYDEHYIGSPEAGSVASIDYVTEGISMAVAKVDKSKVINAIPFYSRVWKTQNGQVTSEAYGIQDTLNYVSNHNMTVSWNAEAGQNYAETTEDGVLLQIWIEDNQSIALKLDAMTAADIAGVAEWKLEFDTVEVWDVIANYMNQ